MNDHTLTARDDPDSPDTRLRIIQAAADLIASGGEDAATTRAVATAAAVQAPTIYRLFGDKRGLLEAVAEHGLAAYVARKSGLALDPDPVHALRAGWDMHVSFGLANPDLYRIMTAHPRAQTDSPTMAVGYAVLRQRVRNIALAGRLRVTEERAVAMLQSMCLGTVLGLLGKPADQRDAGLSDMVREALVAAIASDPVVAPGSTPGAVASTLRAALPALEGLSQGERFLLDELLVRIAGG